MIGCLLTVCAVRQFTQDFVHDCITMAVAYVCDPTRRSRFADQLEEEVVHHGAILQGCNVVNANLVDAMGAPTSAPAMPSVPSMITGYLRTAPAPATDAAATSGVEQIGRLTIYTYAYKFISLFLRLL